MEFFRIFGFLKIWRDCIKVFLKNFKLTASIAALSLLLSSALILLFTLSVQSAFTNITNSINDSAVFFYLQIAIFCALALSVELTIHFSYIVVARAAGIATVITAAWLYTGAELSLRDLFSAVESKWRSPFGKTYRRFGNPIHYLWIFAAIVAIPLLMRHPNHITIAIVSALVVTIYVYMIHVSVVLAVSAVVPVVEDGCEAAEAFERAKKLVEGQRLLGFMANLSSHVMALIVWLAFWMIVGDKGELNLTVYGLFYGDCAIALTIFLCGVYTVYYFRCREYHGEEIQPYAALPADIP